MNSPSTVSTPIDIEFYSEIEFRVMYADNKTKEYIDIQYDGMRSVLRQSTFYTRDNKKFNLKTMNRYAELIKVATEMIHKNIISLN